MTLIREIPKNSQEIIKLSITEFKGKPYGDLRVYYRDDNDEWRPTRKGLTLAPDLIPEVRAGIEELEQAMREDGLIEDDEELAA